nr:hypothetical protein Q903MT_gene1183 [Picea sitchensis]
MKALDFGSGRAFKIGHPKEFIHCWKFASLFILFLSPDLIHLLSLVGHPYFPFQWGWGPAGRATFYT